MKNSCFLKKNFRQLWLSILTMRLKFLGPRNIPKYSKIEYVSVRCWQSISTNLLPRHFHTVNIKSSQPYVLSDVDS